MNYISEFYRSRARWHYGVAVLAVAIALLLKLLLIPLIDRESPFLLFFAMSCCLALLQAPLGEPMKPSSNMFTRKTSEVQSRLQLVTALTSQLEGIIELYRNMVT